MSKSKNAESEDNIVEVEGQKYELKKISGYRLTKVVGDGNRDTADVLRDLIIYSVKDPEMNQEEVEELGSVTFFDLGFAIYNYHEDDLKKLEERGTNQ